MKAILLGGVLLASCAPAAFSGIVGFGGEGIEIKTNDARATEEKADGRDVLKAQFDVTEKWAFVRIVPVSGAWDLSKYSGIEVDITNDGGVTLRPGVRVDESGKDPAAQVWNSAQIQAIEPGETKTILVKFGLDYNKPREIDSSRIGAVHIFLEKGRQEPSQLTISAIRGVE